MSWIGKYVPLAWLLSVLAACNPGPPEGYKTALALPNPPEASAVAHLRPEQACAALVGDPLEGGAEGRGAFIPQIDYTAALTACDAAVANARGTRTDYYNRARALESGMTRVPESERAKWVEDALTAYETAADKGHPYALMLLADLRNVELPNRPADFELSARYRKAAYERLGTPGSWWPETKLYVGLARLRGDNGQLLAMSNNDNASLAKLLISDAARGGMVRYIRREYDRLRCNDMSAPAHGDPVGEVCEMLLESMARNGMVSAAAELAVREYNAGVKAAQRLGDRHNEARDRYSRGKFWAEMALDGQIDADANALRLAGEVHTSVIRMETRLANQDRAVMAVVELFGNAMSGASRGSSSMPGYEVDISHITDPRLNGTCLGAGLTGDILTIIENGC